MKNFESGGGSVHFIIAGSIVGDRATIRTNGDGLIYDANIEFSPDNEFIQEVSISFSANSLPEGDITGYTLVVVYGSVDTLQVELESCVLRY